MNKVNAGAEFGTYNHYTYRICYGLTKDGKMDYSIPHYEFIKHCRCKNCQNRLKYDRFPTNSLTIITDDKSKFPEIERILDEYACNEIHYMEKTTNYLETMIFQADFINI